MDFMLYTKPNTPDIVPFACGYHNRCKGCKNACTGCSSGCKGCTGGWFIG